MIVWNSGTSTLLFYGSKDGVRWTNIGSRGSMSQPDQIGIGLFSNGGSIPSNAFIQCDWFRVSTP